MVVELFDDGLLELSFTLIGSEPVLVLRLRTRHFDSFEITDELESRVARYFRDAQVEFVVRQKGLAPIEWKFVDRSDIRSLVN